jgi:GTPase SAR1 family protein
MEFEISSENHLKILVFGAPFIGKTEFVKTFIDFETNYETLIGGGNNPLFNYFTRNYKLQSRPNDLFKYHIWDLTDYDEAITLIRSYIDTTQVILLCFSLKNPDSLNSLTEWLNEINEKKENNKLNKLTKCLLVGLRYDYDKINKDTIIKFCLLYNVEYIEVHMTNKYNVVKPFIRFINDLYPEPNIIIVRNNNHPLTKFMNYCMIL